MFGSRLAFPVPCRSIKGRARERREIKPASLKPRWLTPNHRCLRQCVLGIGTGEARIGHAKHIVTNIEVIPAALAFDSAGLRKQALV